MAMPGRDRISSHELAELLRGQILTGELSPGARIPSNRYLQETYGVGRDLVRRAIAVLRAEGLVVTRQGKTSHVRQVHPKEPVDLTNVVRVEVRMPTMVERDRLLLDEGVPVFVVWRLGAREALLLPGDRWELPGPAYGAGTR